MLVLSRKQDESLVIGDNIIVTILAIDRDQVRLGIDAPRDIPIVRFELFEAVREQSIIAEQLTSASGVGMKGLRDFLMGQAIPDEDK